MTPRTVAAGLAALALAPAAAAAGCEIPEQGSVPLRRAITQVKYLPQTETWQKSLPDGTIAQFVLLLDAPRTLRGRCYWPVEVRAGGKLWKRFLVEPGSGRAVEEPAR